MGEFRSLCVKDKMNELGWPLRDYIVQIARFDPSKGIPNVLDSYAKFRVLLEGKVTPDEIPQLLICGHGAVDDPDGLNDVKRAVYRSLVLGNCERQPPDAEPTGDDEPSYVDRLLGPEIAPEVLLATSLWYLWPIYLFFRTWSLYTTRSSTR